LANSIAGVDSRSFMKSTGGCAVVAGETRPDGLEVSAQACASMCARSEYAFGFEGTIRSISSLLVEHDVE
jgi:hypothetical protein